MNKTFILNKILKQSHNRTHLLLLLPPEGTGKFQDINFSHSASWHVCAITRMYIYWSLQSWACVCRTSTLCWSVQTLPRPGSKAGAPLSSLAEASGVLADSRSSRSELWLLVDGSNSGCTTASARARTKMPQTARDTVDQPEPREAKPATTSPTFSLPFSRCP